MKFVKIVINGEEFYRKLDEGAEDREGVFELAMMPEDTEADCGDTCECRADSTAGQEGDEACGSHLGKEGEPKDKRTSGVVSDAERLLGRVVSKAKDLWGKAEGRAKDILGRMLNRNGVDKK